MSLTPTITHTSTPIEMSRTLLPPHRPVERLPSRCSVVHEAARPGEHTLKPIHGHHTMQIYFDCEDFLCVIKFSNIQTI